MISLTTCYYWGYLFMFLLTWILHFYALLMTINPWKTWIDFVETKFHSNENIEWYRMQVELDGIEIPFNSIYFLLKKNWMYISVAGIENLFMIIIGKRNFEIVDIKENTIPFLFVWNYSKDDIWNLKLSYLN